MLAGDEQPAPDRRSGADADDDAGPAPSAGVTPAAVAQSSLPSRSPTPAPARGAAASSAAGPSPVAKAERPWQHAVRTSLSGPTASSGRLKTQPGATLALTLESRPTMYRGGVGGNERVIQTTEWTQHDVAEMRFCISTRGTADGRLGPQRVDCALPETWMPFEASRTIPLVVEWIGPGEVMAQAQFRRADGTIVESITSNYERVETSSSFFWADSILDPNVPVASLPPSVQAAAAERLAAYPVTGSVKIKNSPCCVGGPAGRHDHGPGDVQRDQSARPGHGDAARRWRLRYGPAHSDERRVGAVHGAARHAGLPHLRLLDVLGGGPVPRRGRQRLGRPLRLGRHGGDAAAPVSCAIGMSAPVVDDVGAGPVVAGLVVVLHGDADEIGAEAARDHLAVRLRPAGVRRRR